MAPILDPNTADFVAARAGEQLLVWLRQDSSATYGTVAGNGATNFLNGRVADAILFVNNAAQQGWATQRFSERWQRASEARTPNGQRRNQALLTFAVSEHGMGQPNKTVSIYQQNGQFMLMEIENGEPLWHPGSLHEVLAEMFTTVKPGWQVVRVSPEITAMIENGLADVVPASE
jgi:hypothetical protein